MQEYRPNPFEDVFNAELEELAKRQQKPAEAVDRKALAGLALSGGGIRSATTSLGVLQALKSLGLLGVFDYLSTVSGGGFAGGWWSAWTSRNFGADTTKEEKFFPPPEQTQPERDAAHEQQLIAGTTESNSSESKPIQNREKKLDPVHHLRLFSNYLTPMKGPLSADTWRANAVVSRNLALTWLVLVPMIFAAVLLAQSYFTMQPNSEMEFLYPYSHFADDNARTQSIDFELKVANRLDSMVHGASGASSLAPIRELRELGAKKHPAKIVTSDEQFAIIARDIDSLRNIDSASEVDLGDLKSFPMLQGELNRIEQGILQWRIDDSLVLARHSVASATLPAAPKPDTSIKNNPATAMLASASPSDKPTGVPSAKPSPVLPSAMSPAKLPSAKHHVAKSSTKTRTALPSTKSLAATPPPKPAAAPQQTAFAPAVSLVPLNTFLLEKAKDSIDKYYQAKLDPDVDSVKVRLIVLERALNNHREEMRDGWLFNDAHLGYLADRAVWASYLPIMMLGWMVMVICLWMINTNHKMFGGNVLQGSYAFIGGLITFDGLNWLIPHIVGAEPDMAGISSSLLQIIWAVVALIFLSLLLWDNAHWFWKKNHKSMNDDMMQEMSKLLEVRRARIVSYHQRLLLGAVLVSVLLCFGGFGHEAINYLLFYHSKHAWDIGQWIARFGGVAVIFGALAGSGLAARNATSTERGNAKKESKIKNMLIALAPPLILLLLLCSVAWAGHWITQDIVFRTGRTMNQHYVILIFSMWLLGFLTLYYSVYDLHFRVRPQNTASVSSTEPPKMHAKQFSRLLLVAILFIQVAMMVTAVAYPSQSYRFPYFWAVLPIAVWGIVAWKYRSEQKHPQPAAFKHASGTAATAMDRPTTIGSRILDVLRAGGTSLLILGFSTLMLILVSTFMEIAELPIDHLFLVALGATLLILLVDLLWGVRRPEDGLRGNHEARVLLGINATLYTLFLIIPPLYQNSHWGVTHVLEILISLAIGLVIFVGWRVDPNALSIHSFYRDRLVRAYLGASNRFRNRSSVSDVNTEDDIPLTKLTNCEQGAPYHLINTTLNLLGTKSLETAQRHASNFILSKRFCGSVTTGYRPTEEYMSSSMTLGTAIAISGAAASPNMGSNQVSGATTMLMSLLNVRLGYWAANPGRALWREAQPKLWPYYLLKESLSQTTGFGAFCYLTDGGHFDNTGLYPLIERACRFIVVCDNGADPEAHFKDLGNALRRCRIDFGAEFKLDGLKQMTSLGGPSTRNDSGKAHWLRGTVTYSEEHLRTIWGEHWDEGLSAEERANYRVGAILVLKPTLLGDEPVDVLQYGLEYADFPQQSTANQWFSEDQFESYRRLGFWSAQTAFAKSDYGTATREQQLQAIAELPSTKQMPLASPQPLNELAYGPPSDERTPAITFSQPAI